MRVLPRLMGGGCLIGLSILYWVWAADQEYRFGGQTCILGKEHFADEHDALPMPVEDLGAIKLLPPSCAIDAKTSHTFDAVYARGFRPLDQWAKVKPFEVNFDKAGSVIVTPAMIAHYYTDRSETRLSLSGGGSEPETTGPARCFLERVIHKYGITSLLDAPCGDANWQFLSPTIDRLSVYVGLDVAQLPIRLNRHRFAHHSNKKFAQWDLASRTTKLPRFTKGQGPERAFDLVHLRDVFQHMPLKLGLQAARNVVDSGAKYIITTTFPMDENVNDEKPDAFYHNNMHNKPFNFPKPLECVKSHDTLVDGRRERDVTCLWKVSSLRAVVDAYEI